MKVVLLFTLNYFFSLSITNYYYYCYDYSYILLVVVFATFFSISDSIRVEIIDSLLHHHHYHTILLIYSYITHTLTMI